MVQHGRNKKRRAGRTGRTKLKNQTYAKFKPPQYGDPVIQANWDPSKSPTMNLKNLGLQGAPNSSINSRGLDPKRFSNNTVDKKVIELFDVPDAETIAAFKAKNRLPVSVENQHYMVKCFEKYGDNYKKMSRDIKINDMQHTENLLRKMGSKFLLLSDTQRKVEIPEKIKHLIP